MNTKNEVLVLVRHPSGYIPVAMSLTAFAVVIGYISIYGTSRQVDEGAAAHIWQLLIGAQVPLIAFFGVKWLPKGSRAALWVLALQLVAILAAGAPVFFLRL